MAKKNEPGVTRTPEGRCLNCGYKINTSGTADASDGAPTEGCLLVCLKCGAVMMYDRDLKPRGMTDAEMDELTADQEAMDDLARIVKRVHLVKHLSG
jgi:hypothetical protein